MATAIPVQTITAYGGAIQDIVFTATAAEMEFVHPGGDYVFVFLDNDTAGLQTIDILGIANNRTYDVATDKSFGAVASAESVGGVPITRFNQGDGTVRIDISGATALFKIAVVKITDTP